MPHSVQPWCEATVALQRTLHRRVGGARAALPVQAAPDRRRQKLLSRQFARDDWSTPGASEQGWRAVKTDLALSRKTDNEQIELLMPDKDVQAYGQLYRNRGDCENGLDELKNQWRWCTTGGVGIAEQPNRASGWRPSRVEHCCSPVSAERSNMPDRQRCISRQCTPQKTS